MSRTKKLLNRVKAGFKSTVAQSKKSFQAIVRRPQMAIVAALVVAGAAGAYWLYQAKGAQWHPMEAARDAARGASNVLLPMKSVEQLQAQTQANPKDADAFMALGDAQFEAGDRAQALHSYSRALDLKAKPSGDMATNLPLLFGTKLQDASAAILSQHLVVDAAPGLHNASSHPNYETRWAAIHTLEKLKRSDQQDYVHAWMQDLDEPRCEVQKHAVDSLGRFGDRRALKAIRAADERDEKNTPWFGITCLGGRPEDAEKAITSRQQVTKPVLAKK
jgi:tetratricopeptide (TPR) repeat protein